MRAIDMCINRFDEDTKLSFRDLYTKLDENVEVEDEEVISTSIESEDSSSF
jgi:hypothetical protein